MTPEIRVSSLRKAYHDGNHNAFTDLVRFRGQYYLTFRNCPDGHMLFTTSRILVLCSDDRQSWREVCAFNVPKRDVRDPHFLVFQDRLWVLSGTWLVDPVDSRNRSLNDHQGYAAWTADGATWQGPVLLEGTHGYYIWRAGAWEDTAYLIGRCVRDFAQLEGNEEVRESTEAWLLKSNDGVYWERAGRIQPHFGDEIAFLFEADASILAVARGGVSSAGQLCRSVPPYTEWRRTSLGRSIGGPLLARWGQRYLVGGRKTVDPSKPRTVLYWLEDDALVEALELPSGGDNSYPGFLELSPSEGLLSYYSSHEGSGTSLAPSAIYLADLTIAP
jgi:hypothetical protein